MKSLVIFLMITVLFSSCRKPIPGDIKISASGFVIDTVKNKLLSGAVVEIDGSYLNLFGLTGGDSVTSTTTDRNGNFFLSFITDGKFYAYNIRVRPMRDDNFTRDISRNSNKEVKTGENNDLRLKARELNFLKETLIIDQNPYDTLAIWNSYDISHFYNKHKIDTVLYFLVLPMAKNYFFFHTWDSKIGRERLQILDTLDIKMADTTYFTKHINNLEIKID
jgi:hypothetical protein